MRNTGASTIFPGGGGGGSDPEAIYNLFDFKNHVMKIMSKSGKEKKYLHIRKLLLHFSISNVLSSADCSG
jgi:hypothetical protein